MSFIIFLFSLIVFFCGCGFFPHTDIALKKASFDLSDKTLPAEKKKLNNSSFLNRKNPIRFMGKKSVDILFVVDTSYSMVQYLEKVDQTFKNFVPTLSPVSWKIAFTNADYDPNTFSYYDRDLFNGKLMRLEWNGNILPYKILNVSFENNEEVFLNTLKRYEHGDISDLSPSQYINPCDLPPYCQGHIRNPIYSLINSFSINKKFFRNYADFVAVIFTNGDNMYSDSNVTRVMMSEFRKHHGLKKKINIYSISIIPGDEECFNLDQANQYNYATSDYGEQIHKLVQITGGKAISICAPDYSPLAFEIVRSFVRK